MPTVFRAPDPVQSTQFIPGGNTPANGAQMFFYVAGSTTKTTVYSDSGGTTAWANPIVLNSAGNLPSNGSVWIPTGVTVDVTLAPSTDSDPPVAAYWTKEDFIGINDLTATQNEWVTGPTPTFVSGTQFTLVGDQTATFSLARRLRFTVTAGTVYGVITSSAYTTLTTINIALDSGALDSGLSVVSYSLVTPQNSSISPDYVSKSVTSVASAGNGTTNIWGIAGNILHVTGTNTINSFSTAPYAGAMRKIIFDGALTLSHNASSLALPGLANVSTAAGDRAEVIASTTANALITFYQRGTGSGIDRGWTLLESRTAVNTSAVNMTTGITSSYDQFLVTMNSV